DAETIQRAADGCRRASFSETCENKWLVARESVQIIAVSLTVRAELLVAAWLMAAALVCKKDQPMSLTFK
ncbi:MAG TPA: hypothetical protein VM715_07715, partial [Candidatus Acidoferrum sp.]|nr:hypothetical protein [Candidatus Acidoferrum sp.]